MQGEAHHPHQVERPILGRGGVGVGHPVGSLADNVEQVGVEPVARHEFSEKGELVGAQPFARPCQHDEVAHAAQPFAAFT